MAIARNTALAPSLGLLIVRLPLAVCFFLAGLQKVNGGVGNFVSQALPGATKYMPEQAGKYFLWTLPFAEMALGALIGVGLLTRTAGFLASMLLVSFTIFVANAMGLTFQNLPFHPNFTWLAIGLCVTLCGPGRFSVDGLMGGKTRTVKVTPA